MAEEFLQAVIASDAFSVFLLTSLFVELKMCLFCQRLINRPGCGIASFCQGEAQPPPPPEEDTDSSKVEVLQYCIVT